MPTSRPPCANTSRAAAESGIESRRRDVGRGCVSRVEGSFTYDVDSDLLIFGYVCFVDAEYVDADVAQLPISRITGRPYLAPVRS